MLVRKFVISLGIALLFIVFPKSVCAQYSMGSSGLLNIPTAEWNETGTVRLGGNFLSKEVLPQPRMEYNSFNLFADIQLFSFLEVSYRELGLKVGRLGTSNAKFNLDRSLSFRFNVLKESKWIPSLAVGAHDPFSPNKSQYNETYYGVMTKHFGFGNHVLSASLGYYYGKSQHGKNDVTYTNCLDGPFGGVCFQPGFYKPLKFMAEYDSVGFNVGAAVTLWKHLGLHCFTREFKGVVAGVRYEGVLLH